MTDRTKIQLIKYSFSACRIMIWLYLVYAYGIGASILAIIMSVLASAEADLEAVL